MKIFLIIRCMKARPTGIVLLMGLRLLGGILDLGMTFYLFTLTYFASNAIIFFTLSGMISLILAYGLWIGQRWARWITLILSIVEILFWLYNILSMIGVDSLSLLTSIIHIVISLVIIYYLTRPHIKDYFR